MHAELFKKDFIEKSIEMSKKEKFFSKLEKKNKSKIIKENTVHDDKKDKRKEKKKKDKIPKENIVEEEHKPKKKVLNILNKKLNPIIEEPITPLSHIQNGFRESPITPKGGFNDFKVTAITPVSSFEKRSKQNLKRKLANIKEPTHVPPKVVWASSGAFAIEPARPIEKIIPTSSATQFKVSLLGNNSKKIKVHLPQIETASTAMNFKKNKLYQQKGLMRVSAREILSNYEKSKFSENLK